MINTPMQVAEDTGSPEPLSDLQDELVRLRAENAEICAERDLLRRSVEIWMRASLHIRR